MIICNKCGALFDEPSTAYDYHSEVDTRCYEPYSVCPACNSDNIEECRRCEVCGEFITERDHERTKRKMEYWCLGCEDTIATVLRTAESTIEACTGAKKPKDAIAEWVERNY